MSQKILVTGGTGFLGSYIIQELVNKGYEVTALRRGNKSPTWIPQPILEKARWLEGDILDVVSLEDAMEGIDTVIHAAAMVSFIRKDRKKMMHINVEGTANVVNMALEKNIRRMIHISSVAALGRTAGGGHVDENKKWEESKINTNYAISKQQAELQVWRGMSEGLEAVILNPSTILGFGDWNTGSCAIFRNIYNGIRWYPPGINGFVDVEDVARIAEMLINSPINEERFIVNGDNWSFRKIQDTITAGFHKKGPVKAAGPFLLSMARRLEKFKSMITGKKPLVTRESVKVALSKTYFENNKILKAFPEFRFTPLEASIGKACEKYLVALPSSP